MENKIILLIIVILTVTFATSVWAITKVPTTADEQRQIEEYKNQYDSYEAALQGLVDMQNTCKDAAEEFDNQIKSCEDNKEKLSQSCKTDKPTCDCQTLSSTIEALEKDNKNIRSSMETSQKVVEELRQSSKSERESCTVDLEAATGRIKQLEKELLDCQRPTETVTEQVNSLTLANQKLENQVSQLENRNASLESENHEIQNTLTEQRVKNASLSSQLESSRERLRERENELSRKESEIEQLRGRLNSPVSPISVPILEGVYGIVVTKETSLNVRAGPGEGYSIIDKAPNGLNLKILDKVDVWYKIQVGNGSVGYVRSDYVKPLRAGAYANAFPKYSCGDHNPGGIHEWYPVWIDDSSDNFEKIHTYYCRDIFRKTYEGNAYIQVASFLRKANARGFAEFMQREVGSGRVGEMITTGE